MIKNGALSFGNVSVNRTFLKESVIKNCSDQEDVCMPTSGVNVADLSIWDEALSPAKMIKWTKCRF